jgi:hypothetical protein
MKTKTERLQYFRLWYADGRFEIVSGKNALEIIRRFDLCAKAHVDTRLAQLSGEQEAIARANDSDEI